MLLGGRESRRDRREPVRRRRTRLARARADEDEFSPDTARHAISRRATSGDRGYAGVSVARNLHAETSRAAYSSNRVKSSPVRGWRRCAPAPRRSARRAAAVGVPVEDEVGAVRADRGGEAARAEERPDRLGLAVERLADRRVVEQHDAPVAAGDRLEPALDRVRLGRRLGVDRAQQRLAEVGDLGAFEAADEALRADDADLVAADLEHARLAARAPSTPARAAPPRPGRRGPSGSRGSRAPRRPAPSTVAHASARTSRLLRLAVRRQVAREQDQVGVAHAPRTRA